MLRGMRELTDRQHDGQTDRSVMVVTLLQEKQRWHLEANVTTRNTATRCTPSFPWLARSWAVFRLRVLLFRVGTAASSGIPPRAMVWLGEGLA